MKAKILILVVLFIASVNCCIAQSEFIKIDLEETVYLDKKTCLKKTGEPLTGNFAIKFNRYQTNYETFIDGLKNGEFRVFRNKKLAEKGLYRNNLRIGEWLYYNEDGTIRRRSIYVNGLQEGIATDYYNGQIVKTSTYIKNRLNGWQMSYSYSSLVN